ncbi:MAG: hypothetical protein K9N49_06735 [Candidatus Marinimicrobia bacterium]|nr:hypothetical protein [Candidatus Neomarinimicrobiota bacterium]
MKIALNMDKLGTEAEAGHDMMVVLRTAATGDFVARNVLYSQYLGLITNLAKRRADDVAQINRLMEKGKEALFTAVAQYKEGTPPEKFKLQALEAIERAMEDRPKGWLARLFGK